MLKLYEKILDYLKQNIKFFIFLIILFFVCTIELPFYIDTPGGLLDVSTRVEMDGYESKGSFNLAYVSELKATIPTFIYALLDKDWDILPKKEVVAENTNVEEIEYRNHLLLEESKQNAIIVGFEKAGEYYEITNRNVNIVYIYEEADTDLMVSDEIIKVNDNIIYNKEDVLKYINESSDEVKFTVINDGKEYKRYANKVMVDGSKLVGIVVSETKEVDTNKEVNFKFRPSESGPSGGFMMALSIYNYLIEEDLTNGLKIVGTGTIDESGNVGSIGGIEYKIKAAVKEKADLFFAPSANYEEAKQAVLENDLDIELISVSHIDEAIDYLVNIK